MSEPCHVVVWSPPDLETRRLNRAQVFRELGNIEIKRAPFPGHRLRGGKWRSGVQTGSSLGAGTLAMIRGVLPTALPLPATLRHARSLSELLIS